MISAEGKSTRKLIRLSESRLSVQRVAEFIHRFRDECTQRIFLRDLARSNLIDTINFNESASFLSILCFSPLIINYTR